MNVNQIITVIIFSFLLLNCNNSDDDSNSSRPESTDITLITGINLRMSDVSAPIQLGNPNVLTDNFLFVVYPNPTAEFVSIQSQATITDVWFVPSYAEKIYDFVDFTSILNSNLYTEDTIASNSAFQLNNLESTQLLINVEDLNEGYYKLFMKINDTIYWDNIFVHGNNFDVSEFINTWND